MVRKLEGGCDVPIASFAVWQGEDLWLRALVGSSDGDRLLQSEAIGRDPEALGNAVAEQLLAQGAAELLESARA